MTDTNEREEFDHSKFIAAIGFASAAHHGQIDKSGLVPYIFHPMAVARLVASRGGTDDEIIAALLHDTVEDTDITEEDLASVFGDEVARIVMAVTERDDESYPDFITRVIEGGASPVLVKLCDIDDNQAPERVELMQEIDPHAVARWEKKYPPQRARLLMYLIENTEGVTL